MTITYSTSAGILVSALRFKYTIIPMVIMKPEFFLLLGLNVFVNYMHKSGQFNPKEQHVELAMGLTSVTGSLMTFFVVFYNGNVFSRYQKLYELTKNMNENCLVVASLLAKELKDDRQHCRKLSRMILASCFLFFFGLQPEESDGSVDGISKEKWAEIRDLGLLDDAEMNYLKKHCLELGHKRAIPSFILLQWSMRLYRTKINRVPDLDKGYYSVRKCQQDIVEAMELPMPFQYFHIMNLMLLLNLCLWAYSLALQDSLFAPVIFFFVQLMFQGIREVSIALSDPFGDDAVDFPLNQWMSELYARVTSLIEDTWDVNDHVQNHGQELDALPLLKKDKEMIDMLEHVRRHEKINKARGRSKHNTRIDPDGGPIYSALPKKSQHHHKHGPLAEDEDDDSDLDDDEDDDAD